MMPYADWANHCDDGLKLTLDKHREDSTAFLIPEVESKEDEDRVLKKYFGAIFEHELFAWTTDERTWPKQRNLKTFKEWFEVEFHGVAIDLCDKPLWRESVDDESTILPTGQFQTLRQMHRPGDPTPDQSTRTIYRCTYMHRSGAGPAGESQAFKTEQEARAYAERLKARGYLAVIWRMREIKTGRRWEADLDHEATQALDP
jgi:hypothetical protein